MMDPKRRVCLALDALVETVRASGTKTLTPECLLAWISGAAELVEPEGICYNFSASFDRFYAALTNAELTGLREEYKRGGRLDLEERCQAVLSKRATS